MIQCPDCDAYEPQGSLYCGECGAFLLQVVTQDGDLLPFTDELVATPTPALLGQEMHPTTEVKHITFVIPQSGRRFQVELGGDIRIGRADPTVRNFPDLDLTADAGSEHGVSRQHALIRASAEGVVVVDLGSTNGTFLNNYRLPADLPYPIHSGDELKLGQLLVHVFLD